LVVEEDSPDRREVLPLEISSIYTDFMSLCCGIGTYCANQVIVMASKDSKIVGCCLQEAAVDINNSSETLNNEGA
jgi:hypothetical protein